MSDLQCWVPGSCQGDVIDSHPVAGEESCLDACKDESDCSWFTYDDSNGLCLLLANCEAVDPDACPTCWSGQVQCGERRGKATLQYYTC